MKFLEIIPEFRILKLTFYRKSSNGISQIIIDSVYLKTINYLNLKLLMFYMYTASFNSSGFWNSELSPMCICNVIQSLYNDIFRVLRDGECDG